MLFSEPDLEEATEAGQSSVPLTKLFFPLFLEKGLSGFQLRLSACFMSGITDLEGIIFQYFIFNVWHC